MNAAAIIRAWKGESGRTAVAAGATYPENPAGIIQLSDKQMGGITGGAGPTPTIPGVCDLASGALPRPLVPTPACTETCTIESGCPPPKRRRW